MNGYGAMVELYDREIWYTGRKTLYSVRGRWMNGYGPMVEWYRQGNTELLGEKHYTAWVVGEWMGMEKWWNDTAETEVPGEEHYLAWVVGGGMSMEKYWKDTDRENWSAGRKTIYSVGGR